MYTQAWSNFCNRNVIHSLHCPFFFPSNNNGAVKKPTTTNKNNRGNKLIKTLFVLHAFTCTSQKQTHLSFLHGQNGPLPSHTQTNSLQFNSYQLIPLTLTPLSLYYLSFHYFLQLPITPLIAS